MSTTTSTSPWQEQLVAQREVLNARVAAARSAGAPVDALRAALVEMAPAADHLARSMPGPEAFAAAVLPLVDAVARLVARRAWHEASAERWALLGVVPFLPQAVSRSPEATLEVVVQGAARTVLGTDLGAWGRRLAAADEHLADDDAFRQAAAVAAWRSGFVRVRQAALAAAAQLPDAALTALLDLPAWSDDGAGAERLTSPREVLARNAADPFWWPGAPISGRVARVGGFRGSSGPWVGVPVVLGRHDAPTPTWRVWADDQPWVVLADAHGTAVLRDHAARSTAGAAGTAGTAGTTGTTETTGTEGTAGTAGVAKTAGTAGTAHVASTTGTAGGPPAADAPPQDLLAAVAQHLGSDDRVTGASPVVAPASGAASTATSDAGGLVVLVSQQTSYRLDLLRLAAQPGGGAR